MTEHEVQHQLDGLHEHMQPEPVGTNLLNQPGSSYVYKDPLGVCLIIGSQPPHILPQFVRRHVRS